MLVWKAIDANPGIDRAGIWKIVEAGIPAGYALRRYVKMRGWSVAEASATDLSAARSHVLTVALNNLRKLEKVKCEGYEESRTYFTVSRPRYAGRVDAIDLDGTIAADHLSLAGAIRTLHDMIARAQPNPHAPGHRVTMRQREYEALQIVLAAVKNHPAD